MDPDALGKEHEEPAAGDELEALRATIDELDRELVRLLGRRMAAVRDVARRKQETPDRPLRDATREEEVYRLWAEEAAAVGLPAYFVGRVLREVLHGSRRDQERSLRAARPARRTRTRVGYQGVEASYSDLALTKLFTARGEEGLERRGFRTFEGAIDALERGELDCALLPVENTIVGTIAEADRLLADRAVVAIDEEVWPVDHVLAGIPGASLADVTRVRSHPVALQQCRRFIESLGGAAGQASFDTAAAARDLAVERDPHVAVICSEEAARRHGLEILAHDVADQPANFTRFLLLAREPEEPETRLPGKTSLLMTLAHRRGALATCLESFARAGVNLTKLESRPMADAPWEYLFRIDVEGWLTDEGVARALEEIRPHLHHLKIIGTYPHRASEMDTPARVRRIAERTAGDPAPPTDTSS